jgi:hypothetical protein
VACRARRAAAARCGRPVPAALRAARHLPRGAARAAAAAVVLVSRRVDALAHAAPRRTAAARPAGRALMVAAAQRCRARPCTRRGRRGGQEANQGLLCLLRERLRLRRLLPHARASTGPREVHVALPPPGAPTAAAPPHPPL